MSDLNIKSWAEEDRPREKMLLKGREALSESELLAIILGSGSRNESAVDLAKRILTDAGDLNNLGRRSLDMLMEYKGVGEAKAIGIIAAMELGRRRQTTPIQKKGKIASSIAAYHVLGPILADLPYEEFWTVYLNTRGVLIAKERIGSGGVKSTLADPQVVFEHALRHRAASIILYHNHPSGEVKPSKQDMALTDRMKQAGEIMGIKVIDHLIIGHAKYYSFTDDLISEV